MQITGTIQGDDLAARQAGTSQLAGVPAQVQCNGHTTTAGASGTFTLSLPSTASLSCTVAAPGYTTAALALSGVTATHIQLDLVNGFASNGPPTTYQCPIATGMTTIKCPALLLQPGDIAGQVVEAQSKMPIAQADIHCLPTGSASLAQTGTTDVSGKFIFTMLYPGAYLCIAHDSQNGYQGETIHVAPAKAGTVNLSICHGCHQLGYHGGMVMHTYTAYTIFWQPAGFTYEPQPGGDDARYRALMAQYLTDVNGSSFYDILTQYWDTSGPIMNHVSLAGSFIDTSPFRYCEPGGACGIGAHSPYATLDTEHEIAAVIKANHWQPTPTTEFLVFLPFITDHCTAHPTGCGDFYHTFFSQPDGSQVIYAVMSSAAHYQACLDKKPTPTGDCPADEVMQGLAHEQFESITDPYLDGWIFDDTYPQNLFEVGDWCSGHYGQVRPDGSNVTLQGRSYLVQTMWSNHAAGCVLAP